MKRIDRRAFLKRAGAGVVGAAAVGCSASAGKPARKYAGKYAERLKRLAEWVARSFVGDGIDLVPNLPTGRIRGGRDRPDLRNLYWLQNCNLYAMVALRPYDRDVARKIEASYGRWYETEFAGVPERTEHYLAVGKLPEVEVPPGRYLRNIVKLKEFDGYRIGTETCEPGKLGRIRPDDPRTLLKYATLRAHLEGDGEGALKHFRQAMGLWDGHGFPVPAGSKRHESYRTRNLAYALIAARALGADGQAAFPAKVREEVERRLWACQDDDGGIWTNYSKDGTIPGLAKKTTEIGPLTLLAYDRAVWPGRPPARVPPPARG